MADTRTRVIGKVLCLSGESSCRAEGKWGQRETERQRDKEQRERESERKGRRHLYGLQVGYGECGSGIGRCSCRSTGTNISKYWLSRIVRCVGGS